MNKSNFALRLQPSLMEEAKKVAKAEGIAVNQLINVAIAEKLSVLRREAPRSVISGADAGAPAGTKRPSVRGEDSSPVEAAAVAMRHADLLKWSFLFWVGQGALVAGLVGVLLRVIL